MSIAKATDRRDQRLQVLLVDDDDDDVRLTTKTLAPDDRFHCIHRVQDGIEAMDYLYQKGKFEGSPPPDLILLDLNMPRMDGREVLSEIKNDPRLSSIPTVVFTTSEDSSDMALSDENRANGYVTKPVDLGDYRRVLRELRDRWFNVAKLYRQLHHTADL